MTTRTLDPGQLPVYLRELLTEHKVGEFVIDETGTAQGIPQALAEVLLPFEVKALAKAAGGIGSIRVPDDAEAAARSEIGANPWSREGFNLTMQVQTMARDRALAARLRSEAEADGTLDPRGLKVA